MEDYDYHWDCMLGGNTCGPAHGPPPGEHLSCSFKVLSSNSSAPLYLFDNDHIGYEYVCESDDSANANGSIEHKFDVSIYYNRNLIRGVEVKSQPTNTIVTTIGSEISTKVYNATNTLKRATYNYINTHAEFLTELKAHAVRRRYGIDMFDDHQVEDTLHPWDDSEVDFQSYWVELDSTVTFDYDSYDSLKSKVTNYYGTSSNVLPARTETINSKGQTTSTAFYYPTDFSSTFPYNRMINKNVISPVVEQVDSNQTLNMELARVKKYYDSLSAYIFRPDSIQRSFSGGTLTTEVKFDLYDTKGNLKQMTAKNGIVTSYMWGYDQLYPIAQIVGIGYNDAYTNSGIDLSSFGGVPDDGSGQTQLDLLRSLSNVIVTTFICRPYIGLSIQSDARGKYTYYSYDNIGRLNLVKDQDGKILKKICYVYAGHTEYCSTGCSSTSASWANTTTPERCQVDSIGRFNGYQEQEQKDTSYCSPTYGQTKWVVTGYNTDVCPISDSVTVHSINYVSQSGYYVVFVNNNTGLVLSFPISSSSGTQTLGTIISGNYSIIIYKPGGTSLPTNDFGACSNTITGTSATFDSINISSSCHTVTINTAE
jgi:hypothetical protein